MKLQFIAKNVTISDAVEQHFTRKLQRMERHLGRDTVAYITCSRIKSMDRVEITLQGAGIEIRAEDEAGDMYSALDLVCERLERQVEKYKTRFEQKRRQRESIRKATPERLPDLAVPAGDDAAADSAEQPHLVRSKHFALKPLDPEEACMQMELIGHTFFVFINDSTNSVNVVYKRNDGNYGLIEPE